MQSTFFSSLYTCVSHFIKKALLVSLLQTTIILSQIVLKVIMYVKPLLQLWVKQFTFIYWFFVCALLSTRQSCESHHIHYSLYLVKYNVHDRICTKGPISFNRVHTGPGKPGKSWNFIMSFSRTGKFWRVLEICSTQPKNMKCMEGSKEN